MALRVVHAKVSAIPDGPDDSVVRPSDWNADHTIEGAGTAAEADTVDLLARANHTGTQTASTISDFDTEVSNNADVAANTAARHDAVTVTDSAEIDFTLTGQEISASIVAGSIDETKLDASVNASLDLADSSLQPGDIGSTVQAHSAVLDATTASFTTADEAKLDGIESNADVTDAANVAAAGAVMESDTSTASMSFVVDEDDMASDSATKVPTQQSVKAYVDGKTLVNVKDFGATGDGVTDDTAAINAALASASVLRLYFPAGTYICTAPLEFDDRILIIEGDGQYSSILKWTADCNGLELGQTTEVEHFHIRDVGIITTQAASTRFGILLDMDITAGVQRNPGCIIERVEVKGDVITTDWWGTAIKVTDAAIPIFRDIQIFGRSGGTSAQIASSTDYAIQLESSIILVAPQFDNVWVLEYDTAIYLHTPGTLGIEGVYIESCNLVLCNYGVHAVSDANGGYKPAQIHIVNNHVQSRIQDITVIEYIHVNIAHNFLSSAHDEDVTTEAVYIEACVYGSISENTIQALPAQTATKGIVVHDCAQIAVSDNVVLTPGVGVEFTGITFECYERGTRQAGAGAAFANTNGVASNVSIIGAIERVAAATTGLIAKTSAHGAAMRTITAPAAGITVSNGDGVSGNPTLALANDLSALEGLGSTGIAVRSAADTWVQRSVAAGIGIDVTNGNGVSGNPTVAVKAGTVRQNINGLAAGSVLSAGNTFYFTTFASGTEGVASGVMAVPGTARDLYGAVTIAPGVGQTHTFTLFKNGSAQSLTCQVSGTNLSASDTSNTVSFAAGDTWSIRVVASASAGSTIPKASFSFLPTVT